MNTPFSSGSAQVESVAVAISPTGEEWFHGYGPLTKNRDEAVEFVSADVAEKAVLSRFGRCKIGFWESERAAERNAEIQFRGWSFRVENARGALVGAA